MTSSDKPKKNRNKQNKSRPAATSSISQPVVEDAHYLTAFSSFSSTGKWFAYLSLAVDKHRLRVFDSLSGQSVAEHILHSARVSSLSWCHLSSSQSPSPSKKKRRKSQTHEQTQPPSETVALGLSDGSVLFFSPTHGKVTYTLSHSSSSSAILSVVEAEDSNIWTSSSDSTVRLWNPEKNEMLGSWKNDDRIPYSAMARTADSELLVASHSIRLLSTKSSASGKKPTEMVSFTGHASSIKCLQWETSLSRVVSMAESDRVVSVWQMPSDDSSTGRMVASVQLDSDAHHISLSSSTLLALSASGKIFVYPVPDELVPPASSNRTAHKLPTLLPRSTLSASSKGSTVPVVAASFVHGSSRKIHIARIVGGVKAVLNVVDCQDEDGNFISEVSIPDISPEAVAEARQSVPNKRYTESTAAVGSGIDLGQNEAMDGIDVQQGNLDIDLAELSLGQRLTVLSGGNPIQDDSGSEEPSSTKKQKSKNAFKDGLLVVPAASLTRTLIQALHSSDSKLMETCFAHSNASLIRNTVQRLPPQLAVPLISACVERLGRGARGVKGGGGGASSQRGTGLVTWIKTVLAIHGGHLMTLPDLVARLSGLHSTLTSRLTLQDSLLLLSGRLDMVLSQIEMRSSVAPAPITSHPGKPASKVKPVEKTHYVEGESEDEDEQMDVEVEVDSGNDDGEVEDIELGGSSQEESEKEDAADGDDDDEEDQEEDDDDADPTMNGFIDDEADEEFTEEEEDESE
ncbi:hypothetical protein D9757_002154 [Collybiopsis confluens]|uniref:Small-subunit processome Utp12 domain-containing protein n=1 Tax=Collybiopsis confluens TaxID=2823264 RepID=A0A8H5MFG7_9AGAR|nr:hypothetical protein D9757_002154 [Collybiopsis confluens]